MAVPWPSALDLTFATSQLNSEAPSSAGLQHVPIGSDQIRLLMLMPGKDSERIDCKTFVNDFGQDVHKEGVFSLTYEALSYTWGDRQPPAYIYVENRRVTVTKNLEAALRCIRGRDYIRSLWVDAICIYSHGTATKHLGTMRFAPQFFEGFNFTHLVSQIWQYILPYFQFEIYRYAFPILRLDITTYPCSETRQFSLRRRRSTM
jgi:hypothetical protein